MSLNEKSLTGSEAIRLLSHIRFPKENIEGVYFYDGNDEGREEKILNIVDGKIITSSNQYSINLLNKHDAELILKQQTQQVLDLLDELKTPYEKRAEEMSAKLTAIGIAPSYLSNNQDDMNFVINICESKKVPSHSQREKLYEIVKKSKNMHWSVKFFSSWLKEIETENNFDPIGRLHLGYIYRHTGRFKEAIQVLNVVEFPPSRFNCPPNLLAVLATIRAATFLDVYELHNDKELLFRSRKTIDKAWAISKNHNGSLHEASLVYKRIEAFETLVSAIGYVVKLNKAYADWADW